MLRIYFEHALLHSLSHFWQAITWTNWIWPDLAFGFLNIKRPGCADYELCQRNEHVQRRSTLGPRLNTTVILSWPQQFIVRQSSMESANNVCVTILYFCKTWRVGLASTTNVRKIWSNLLEEYAVEISDFALILFRKLLKNKVCRILWKNK